jgi:cytochrome b involved in lipid metabolism
MPPPQDEQEFVSATEIHDIKPQHLVQVNGKVTRVTRFLQALPGEEFFL